MKIDKKICRYIQKRGDITLPEIMSEFILDYMSAISILEKIKKKKIIRQLGDFRYQYLAPPSKESTDVDVDLNLEFKSMMESLEETELSEKEDENEPESKLDDCCLRIIEKIIMSNVSITRVEAIQKVLDTLDLVENSSDTIMRAALQKAKEEFEQCSDEEFLELRKQLHENND